MSKSDPSPDACIFLGDDASAIARKISRAVTDSMPRVAFDETNRPGISSLLTLHSLLSQASMSEVLARYEHDAGFTRVKEELVALLVHKLGPIRERYQVLVRDRAHLERVLRGGAERASRIASENLALVKDALSK